MRLMPAAALVLCTMSLLSPATAAAFPEEAIPLKRHEIRTERVVSGAVSASLADQATSARKAYLHLTELHARSKKEATPPTSVIVRVRSSRDASFASELLVQSRKLSSTLERAASSPGERSALRLLPDVEVETEQGSVKRNYRLDRTGLLWSTADSAVLKPDAESARQLLSYVSVVKAEHYGKLLPWEEVKLLLPKPSVFAVTELASGLTFQVQRRAGSDHADVQPVTKRDTETMKQIYADGWSWNRKAVLVHAGDQWIAASMNGMPHGGDGIPENGFSGHFCIHFLGSSTHKSDQPDLAHQLMVYRAGGELSRYFDSLSPENLARTFISVMKHKDEELLAELTAGLPEPTLAPFLLQMKELRSIREQASGQQERQGGSSGKDHTGIISDSRLTAEMAIPVYLDTKENGRRSATFLFRFQRPSAASPWRFTAIGGLGAQKDT